MADLIATADGNLTTAATWGVVDATSKLHAENANTALTTAYVESATSTPGAITVDGLAVKVALRAASPSGTMSVRIAQAGATVAGTEVTINVSDLPSRDVGWVFFKFSAPVTLLAATLYTVSAKTSAASQVNLYRNATAGNWSRLLRTTTTGAPAAGDDMYILGEWTAAATKTDRTVTMDSAAATDYGSASTTLAGFAISKGGTLTWGTTAATNYILRLSTLLDIYNGGVMNMGTAGTPCPRDSTQLLEFDSAADGDFGLRVYGTFVAQGLSRTSGKNVVRCRLNTDEAAAQTVLGVDTDTGWKNGDDVAIASTTRTNGQHETRALTVDAGASSITVAAIGQAHSGTAPTQAEVILLTRNVRVQSVSSTFMAYVYFGIAAVVDCDWTSFRYLGTASTATKRGIEIDTATGSVALSYCSIRDFDNNGIYAAAADWNNLSIDNLTGYKVGCQASNHAAIYLLTTTGTTWSLTNIDIIIGNASQGYGVRLETGAGTITNLRVNSGGGWAVGIELGVAGVIDGTWTGFELHSMGENGVRVVSAAGGRINDLNGWRNNFASQTPGAISFGDVAGRFIVDGGSFFGNTTANVDLSTTYRGGEIILRNVTVAGDTTFSTISGIRFPGGNGAVRIRLENCSFGPTSGIFVTHTTADINCQAFARYAEIYLVNTILASTEFASKSNLNGRSFIAYQRVDRVTATHQREYPAIGIVSYDTAVFRSSPAAEKLAPSAASAGQRLESAVKRMRVNSGGTVSISVYVRKTAAYNGVSPRLVMKANPALGIDDDVVLDTMSVGADTWEQLTGVSTPAAEEDGIVEFLIDCTGSAGAVYADDWAGA